MLPGTNKILIIVPCYNEEKRFDSNYWRTIIADNPLVNFIFVNDGSSDRTLNKIGLIGFNSEVISLDKNSGKSEAIRQGWLQKISLFKDWKGFGFIDSDGAFSSKDVKNLIELFSTLSTQNPNYDAILSSRVALAGRTIKRTKFRHYLGRVVSTFIIYSWPESPYDTQSGFKLFSNTEYFHQAISKPFKTRWFFDIELLLRIKSYKKNSLNLWEEPLLHWTEIADSKITGFELIRICKEVLTIKTEIGFTVRTKEEHGPTERWRERSD